MTKEVQEYHVIMLYFIHEKGEDTSCTIKCLLFMFRIEVTILRVQYLV